MLSWTQQAPDRGWLRAHGFAVLTFAELRERFVLPARAAGLERTSLDTPAAPLLARFAARDRVAVMDVAVRDVEDLQDLHGYVLEPAWRGGCRLIVHAERRLDELDRAVLVDEDFHYAWTLERATALASRMSRAVRPPPHPGAPVPSRPLDDEQLAAVGAHDGVVQVIAPAGSGKTTVLVERVRELLRRGTGPERILCTTFNAAAAAELRTRLAAADAASVEARTFHSVGLWILREERRLPGRTRELTAGQWRR